MAMPIPLTARLLNSLPTERPPFIHTHDMGGGRGPLLEVIVAPFFRRLRARPCSEVYLLLVPA
jgi:hypothetical protein